MKLPKMIIFDYAQTLVYEKPYDVLSGIKAVLNLSNTNPYNVTPDEITEFANEIFSEMIHLKKITTLEVHNFPYQNYIYEYYGLEFSCSPCDIENAFENASSSAEPTHNILELLDYLQHNGIRTAVISNMIFSGTMLQDRIDRYIPNHCFEFILSSSEYLYRKPDRRIFELALRKAGLTPDQVWYCGDSPEYDIDGSAKCGIFPVWYKGSKGIINTHTPLHNHLLINDWIELISYLRQLLKS